MSLRSPAGPSTFPSSSSPSSYTSPTSQTFSSIPPPRSHRTSSIAGSMISNTTELPSFSNANALGFGFPPSASRRQTPVLRKISSYSNSISGASTPDYKKRARRMIEKGVIKEGDKDWANIEPDQIFRLLPVGEVRKVEAKMRKEALDKQSELRSMVGTRYRDLLNSATQISTLRNSSLSLSSSLRKISQTCANPDDIAITAETSTQASESEDVTVMLPVAAHMKLLLDAPEALYGFMGNGEYLKAGYLWLVARVTKEGLAGMGDASQAYQPLLQKQWETLQPFRPQIVQRATEKLKSKDRMSTKDLAETLLTIILLDNLPVPDALSLFLSQRLQTLQDILSHPRTTPQPTKTRRRTNSKLIPIEGDMLSIASTLQSAFSSIIETINLSSSVFDKISSKESLIEEMVRLVQVGESIVQPISHPTPIRRNSSSSHQRKASRLASISLPIPPTIPSSSTPPVSTMQVLQSLPSSQILLRYLPSNIIGFTPFITPPNPPNLEEKVGSWKNRTIEELKRNMPEWLNDLHSVQAVWKARSRMHAELKDDIGLSLLEKVNSLWGARIKEIWNKFWDEITQTLKEEMNTALEELVTKSKASDLNPERFVFSDQSFPLPSTSLSAATGPSYTSFLSSLKKRNTFRTPLLDKVLSSLENQAANLKSDMVGLPEDLIEAYEGLAGEGLRRNISQLNELLEAATTAGVSENGGSNLANGDSGERSHDINRTLFVGRVALFLAKQSRYLSDVKGACQLNIDPVTSSLLEIHSRSTIPWKENAIKTAIASLSPLFDQTRASSSVKATWQAPHPVSPTPVVLSSLVSLVEATRHLGIPHSMDLPIGRNLVNEYVRQAETLGWDSLQAECAVQGALDLSFLSLMDGKGMDDSPVIRALLEKSSNVVPAGFDKQLPTILAESIRRTQLLLHPVITHLPSTDPVFGTVQDNQATGKKQSDLRAQLLKFGAPSNKLPILRAEGEVEAVGEFRSPIAVMKPGKRFGLVSITG